jgi:hypothetical protein
MLEKALHPRQLKAVRMIRAGSAADQVCKALRLPLDSVRAVETVCRDVPDDILARLERALSDNEKLRRRIRSRIPIVRAHARSEPKRIGAATLAGAAHSGVRSDVFACTTMTGVCPILSRRTCDFPPVFATRC